MKFSRFVKANGEQVGWIGNVGIRLGRRKQRVAAVKADRQISVSPARLSAFSSGVGEGIHHSVVQVSGEFPYIGGAGRQFETL